MVAPAHDGAGCTLSVQQAGVTCPQMSMKHFRPLGQVPTSLEADILKLRAFEMLLVVFVSESLRKSVLASIAASDKLGFKQPPQLKKEHPLAYARRVLVAESVLTQEESDELWELVEIRNTVAHEMHELTADIGPYSDLAVMTVASYDHSALDRLLHLERKVNKGLMKRFICLADMKSVMFATARDVYESEIRRLRARIERGVNEHNRIAAETNALIKSLEGLADELQPGHPKHKARNGTLTASGRACAEELFKAGATPLAVSYMMRVSLRATKAWHSRMVQR